MSRLIVKNLPNTTTSEKLKEYFSSKGVVTDVQLKYTKNGKFRHFGFIGFQSVEEANGAVNYFNNTYINQSKITVEHCAELGDANKPKSWSKYAADSTAYKKLHSKHEHENEEKQQTELGIKERTKNNIKGIKIDSSVEEKIKQHKDDPMFMEFMGVHAKDAGEALKIVSEDKDSGVEEAESDVDDIVTKDVKDKNSCAFANISDLEYLNLKKKKKILLVDHQEVKGENKEVKFSEVKDNSKLFTVKITNLAFSTKKKELKDFFRPLKPAGIRLPRNNSGFAYVSFKTLKEEKRALNKNKSFLKGKQVGVKKYMSKENKEEPEIPNIKNENIKRWKEQEEALLQEESIAESGSIFVRNLTYTITEEDITQLFSPFGPLADVTLPVDRESRKVKGFATVTFVLPENAVAAYSQLDGSVFHGRMLHLLPAKTKNSVDDNDEDKSFKDKKKDKQKSIAHQSHNWNSLFLGQNAVADVMAETYNVSKQDVLTGSDVAVRIALGETQIVSDTKQFLLDSNVSLDAFNQPPKKRSKTVILVKNLTAKTTASEMIEMFSKFGELGRVVLPPSGVTAIVEFLDSSEAKKAFMSLAYTRFKHLPLYLEWAPEDTFNSTPVLDQKNNPDCDMSVISDERKNDTKNEDELGDTPEPEPDTTLYVKNINFNTSEDSVKKHFSTCGQVASVTIARKRDPATPGRTLSMGYGFVQFQHQASTTVALKKLQNSSLDGHMLQLKRSNRTVQDNPAVPYKKKNNVEKQTGTKILVRNIPFQATQKEILQLFKTFGEIKALRLPKKMVGTGSHRGFAFVEFHTKHDAKRAMQALCQSTHLFGRRLVLEWAELEEDIDQLRKRTAQHFKTENAPRSKKSKADIEIEDEDEDT